MAGATKVGEKVHSKVTVTRGCLAFLVGLILTSSNKVTRTKHALRLSQTIQSNHWKSGLATRG